MQHPFQALAQEYTDLLSRCVVTKTDAAQAAANRLLRDLDAYKAVTTATGVPTVWLMATNERESSGSLSAYLGNGEPLYRVTRLVPKGRGPFQPPNAWTKGAIDALGVDQIAAVPVWNWPRMCFEWELWNGFGYRDAHHEHTPYDWGGTNIQEHGKYTSDHGFDAGATDTQLGTVAIARAIITKHPELDVPGWPAAAVSGAIPAPQPAPVGVGGTGAHDVRWVQHCLNLAGFGPIDEDNDYGDQTRRAVTAFQIAHHIAVDGFAGEQTDCALEQAIGGG